MVHHEIRQLPVRHNGRLVTEATFSGQNFTREQIMEITENFARRAPNREFVVLIPYSGGWRSGTWFNNQEPVRLFSLLDYYDEAEIFEESDPEVYDQFKLYVRTRSSQSGGCNGRYNDCLWDCLKHIYGTKTMLPKNIREPENLKNILGIERKKPVPIICLQQLEKELKTISINVCGDATYISRNNSGRVANIILKNGHYSLVTQTKKSLPAFYTKPKKPLIYNIIDNSVHLYNGIKNWTISYSKFIEIKKKRWSGPWCLVSVEKNVITKRIETLEEAYIRFNEESNALCEKTNGFIDLTRNGGSYKITALRLFQEWSLGVSESEPLSPQEAQWISDAMMGGIIWGEKDWKGEANQYDYTSMYPYLMKKKGIRFPIGKGEFQTLENFETDTKGLKIIRYGLYKATIERSDKVKWFRYNPHGIYTFIDLKIAQEQGLSVTLSSCSPNALIYENSKRIAGSVLFGTYVERLFKLKCEGGPAGKVAKKILVMLWGALCEKNKKSYLIGEGTPWTKETPFEPPEDEIFDIPMPVGKGQYKITTKNPTELFRGLYPRVGVFLLAHGRLMISKTIAPFKNNLKRVHTDGFIVQGSIETPKNAKFTLGALKHEKQGYCQVKNAMQVSWS